jgi:hypothetical protein
MSNRKSENSKKVIKMIQKIYKIQVFGWIFISVFVCDLTLKFLD